MRASVKRFVLSPPARAPAAPSCAAGTLARRRLVSGLHPGRLCAAGSSRSSTPDALAPQARLDPPPRTRLRRRLVSIRLPGGELGVGSCPRLALQAAWSPSSSPSCALRADRPLQVVPRPTPLSPARASRLLRLSRALRARRPSRPRGPAPAVHARPRQRLGLGRSVLVGDVAAAARREPRRRPDWSTDGSKHKGRARALTGEESALGHGRVTACLCVVTC